MDSVIIPSDNVPAELKSGCEQILKRAKELKKAEPVVAYWCCFSGAQKALKVANRSNEGTRWLMSLLDALEEMKRVLDNNEAVTAEAAGAAYVENFALKVFMSADNDDRAGNTGKGTIRKFVVAGQFIEVLKCFANGMTEEMEQKLQYARWKAADGAKALREGRDPVSGPPEPDSEINPFPSLPPDSPATASTTLAPGRGSFTSNTRPSIPTSGSSSQSTPVPSPALRPRTSDLPSIETSVSSQLFTPKRTYSSTSVAWSTVATPGLADQDGEEKRFDLNVGPSTPAEPRSPVTGEKKNVRFTGPDGAPLSPATTHFTVDSYDAPDAPPPSVFTASPPVRPRGDSTASTGTIAPKPTTTTSNTTRPRAGSSSSTAKPTRTTAISPQPPAPPPPSLASYPSAPPSQATQQGLGLSSPPPSAPPMSIAPPTRKQMEQTQKHAKWAISALEFEDVETAKSELRKALNMLGG